MTFQQQIDLYEFIKNRLALKLEDKSEPTTCGGECLGSTIIAVSLVLSHPMTGKQETISTVTYDFGNLE